MNAIETKNITKMFLQSRTRADMDTLWCLAICPTADDGPLLRLAFGRNIKNAQALLRKRKDALDNYLSESVLSLSYERRL